MGMPGRAYNTTTGYRYGFNGQEKSTEIDPNGNGYAAEFWQYDSRLARRWNVDPVFKEYESPYASFGNNPIWLIDRNGADTTPTTHTLGNNSQIRTVEQSLQTTNNSMVEGTPSTEIKFRLFPPPFMLIRNHVYAAEAIFKYSGGDELLEKHNIGGTFKAINQNLELFGILNGMRDLPSGKEWNEYTNPDVGLFVSDGTTGSAKAWINAIVGSFVKGHGPENWIFGENSSVTKEVKNSLLGLGTYVNEYYSSGSPAEFHKKHSYGGFDQLADLLRYGGVYSFSNMIGSYDVFITRPDQNSTQATVTIVNIMSMTSGDAGKHIPFNEWPKSWVRGTGTNYSRPEYSNTSQVFIFQIPATLPQQK
jgi:hypothetical protein